MATKREPVEFILQVINLFFTVWALGTLGYGLVCFFKWKHSLAKEIIHEDNAKYIFAHNISQHLALPKSWLIYLIIGIVAVLLIVSCFGYIATATRSPCCLLTFSVFLIVVIIVELVTVVFILFEHNKKMVIPKDRSGSLYHFYHFVDVNSKVIIWVALGLVILQVIVVILALYLRSVYRSTWYVRSQDE